MAPAITSVDPVNGLTGGGTPLTITGTGFQGDATSPRRQSVHRGGGQRRHAAGQRRGSRWHDCHLHSPGGQVGSADVVVANPDGGARTLVGTNTCPPQGAQPSPASLTFAAQQVNTTSATQPVTLTNTGTTPLEIAS